MILRIHLDNASKKHDIAFELDLFWTENCIETSSVVFFHQNFHQVYLVLLFWDIYKSFFLFSFFKADQQPPASLYFFLLLHNRNSSCTCKSHLQTSTTRLSDNKTKNPIGFHKTHICRYFCSTVIWWTDSCSFMPHPERLGCRCGKRGQWVIKVSFWVNVKPHPVLAKTQLLFT